MPGFTRTNGNAQVGSWYGLSPRYLKVDCGNVTIATNYGNTLSNFEKAVFAISSKASIVTLGTPSGNAFVIQVDDSYQEATGNSGVTGSMAAAIQSAINANVVTITESTGFSGGGFANFA
jgi:hypothetical protein